MSAGVIEQGTGRLVRPAWTWVGVAVLLCDTGTDVVRTSVLASIALLCFAQRTRGAPVAASPDGISVGGARAMAAASVTQVECAVSRTNVTLTARAGTRSVRAHFKSIDDVRAFLRAVNVPPERVRWVLEYPSLVPAIFVTCILMALSWMLAMRVPEPVRLMEWPWRPVVMLSIGLVVIGAMRAASIRFSFERGIFRVAGVGRRSAEGSLALDSSGVKIGAAHVGGPKWVGGRLSELQAVADG